MNPELWRRVEELFHAALDLSPDARGAFLEKACGEDADLRRHVELLLSNDEHAGSLMEKPILADVMPHPDNEDSFLPTNAVNRASAGNNRYTVTRFFRLHLRQPHLFSYIRIFRPAGIRRTISPDG
jgi:hypothetical protein